MTSESWRVVRFSRYTVLWSEESAKTINQSVSGSQSCKQPDKPFFEMYSKRFATDPAHKR